MKRSYWIIPVWLVAMSVLITLSVANLVINVQQGTLQHWEQEVIRFIALGMLIALSAAGVYHELRHPPGGVS
jgi:hypothetical protein